MINGFLAKRTPKVMVAGTFRSGTNLLKHLFSENYRTDVVFSRWFWKHGLPPTQIKKPIPDRVPIVVITKNPIALNISLYRFWQIRRPELSVGRSISEFVRKPLIVYDNSNKCRDPQYIFTTPTDYWNQFHHAWIYWKDVDDRRLFVSYEDLVRDPDAVMRSIAARIGLERKSDSAISLPEKPVGPTRDGSPTSLGELRDNPTELLTEADVRTIKDLVNEDVERRLGYTRVYSPCPNLSVKQVRCAKRVTYPR